MDAIIEPSNIIVSRRTRLSLFFVAAIPERTSVARSSRDPLIPYQFGVVF